MTTDEMVSDLRTTAEASDNGANFLYEVADRLEALEAVAVATCADDGSIEACDRAATALRRLKATGWQPGR